MKTLKLVSLVISTGIAVLISGCLSDPYSVGEPDSLFSEFVLVRDLVDAHYACFFARENVNWDHAFEKFKSASENLSNREELADLCLEMLGELEDPNLTMRDSSGTRFESWNQGLFLNWDLPVWEHYMSYWSSSDSFPLDHYGAIEIIPTIADNVGYVYISNLGSGFSWTAFFSKMSVIQYCNSIIIDLRMCGRSGFEMNAYYSCGKFIKESTLGYYRVFRTGPGRNDMGEMLEVVSCKNGSWQFTDPIVLLTGRYTQGAAEQLVLLLRSQQHVTVIGDTTAGFANPAVSFNLIADCTIEIPEMVTYSPDGTLIFNKGIAPDILVPVSEADFAAGVDPVLDAALEMLAD